jgi:hypothetical protein
MAPTGTPEQGQDVCPKGVDHCSGLKHLLLGSIAERVVQAVLARFDLKCDYLFSQIDSLIAPTNTNGFGQSSQYW